MNIIIGLAGGAAMHLVLAVPMVAQASLTLSGDPQALVISSAVAGFPPDPVFDEGTAYSIVAEELSAIEVSVDAPLPAGVTLHVQMEPPPGALGAGSVEVGTTPRVLVSSILPGTYRGLGIRYQLAAGVDAGVVPISSRRVTFTVTPNP